MGDLEDLTGGEIVYRRCRVSLTALKAATAIPLTLTLHQHCIRVAFPLPHFSSDDEIFTIVISAAPSMTPPNFTKITLEIPPSRTLPDETAEKLGLAVDAGRCGGRNLVEVVQRLAQALR